MGIVDLEWLLRELLDVSQIIRFGLITEGNRDPIASSPCRSADTVDIAFGNIGKVVVEDMTDPIDVDTAGGNVCCDQDTDISGLEAR